MKKIASPGQLQSELRRILDYTTSEKPSREVIAQDLRDLARRVAGQMNPKDWTEKGGKWVLRAQYAGGEKHEWTVAEKGGGKFTLTVKTPKGTFKAKKDFSSLEQAQKLAWKFIDKANGNEMLEAALGKDFAKYAAKQRTAAVPSKVRKLVQRHAPSDSWTEKGNRVEVQFKSERDANKFEERMKDALGVEDDEDDDYIVESLIRGRDYIVTID